MEKKMMMNAEMMNGEDTYYLLYIYIKILYIYVTWFEKNKYKYRSIYI